MQKHVGESVAVCAVVKADGYGHGAAECARALESEGATWLGVTDANEGMALRSVGILTRILLMTGIWRGEEEGIVSWNLTPTVWEPWHVERLERAAAKQNTVLPVHLKLDTGMNRLGASKERLPRFCEAFAACQHLQLEGVSTHFAAAEVLDSEAARRQIQNFEDGLKVLKSYELSPPLVHMANSAAMSARPEAKGEPAPAVSAEVAVQRWTRGAVAGTTDQVAEEMPVALVYHDVPHVVMLATPADLEDYAVGFTLSEGLVAHTDEIRGVEVIPGEASVDVKISVAWERFTQLLQRRRNLTGRTGCGLCGAETAEDAIRECAPVPAGISLTAEALHEAMTQLSGRQPINARTGSVHAAAWVVPGKGIQVVREDVGRHNALDKTIGALARAQADFAAGYMLITSRASYEMVQKCATVGVSLLVALSAPTAFAVRLAQRAGLTLVAFARADQHVVYAHPHRIRNQA